MTTLKESVWPRPNLEVMMQQGFEPAAAKWIRSLWDEIREDPVVSLDLYVASVSALGTTLSQARTTDAVASLITDYRRQHFGAAAVDGIYSDVVPAMRALGARACRMLNPNDFESIAHYFENRYKVWGDVLSEDHARRSDLADTYRIKQTEMSKSIFSFTDSIGISDKAYLLDGYCGLRAGQVAGFDRREMQIVLPPEGEGAALAWFEALDWKLYDTLLAGSDIPGPLSNALVNGADTGGHPLANAMRTLVDVMRSTPVKGDALMLRAQQGLAHSLSIFRDAISQLSLDAAIKFNTSAEHFNEQVNAVSSEFSRNAERLSTEWLLAGVSESWEKAFGQRMPVKQLMLVEASSSKLKKAAAKVHGIRSGQIAFTVERTNFHIKSARMDEVSAKSFWTNPSFMASRAFMAWSADKMGHPDQAQGPAFPEGEERVRIGRTVDDLMRIAAPMLVTEQRRERRRSLTASY